MGDTRYEPIGERDGTLELCPGGGIHLGATIGVMLWEK
jgi:hypothetical protein